MAICFVDEFSELTEKKASIFLNSMFTHP